MEPDETEAAESTPPTPTAGRRHAGAPEVIPALYDLILWMAPKLARYPKVHRFTLGDRTMSALLEVLDGLIVARFEREGRRAALRAANLGLERLRYLVRLGRDLHCISLREYEYVARALVDTGRQVGGWSRHAGERGS